MRASSAGPGRLPLRTTAVVRVAVDLAPAFVSEDERAFLHEGCANLRDGPRVRGSGDVDDGSAEIARRAPDVSPLPGRGAIDSADAAGRTAGRRGATHDRPTP